MKLSSKRIPEVITIIVVLVIGGVLLQRVMSSEADTLEAVQTGEGKDQTTSTTFALEGRSYRAGDCVTWDQNDDLRERTRVVDCNEPHLFEYTASVKRWDAPGEYPSDEQWDEILRRECQPHADRHIGYPLDPNGKFTASGIYTFEEDYKAGDQEIQCGIQRHSTFLDTGEDELPSFTGAVKGQDQADLYPAGKCYRSDAEGRRGGIVECNTPHDVEIAGHFEISGAFPETEDAWAAASRDGCKQVVSAYFGGRVPSGVEHNYLQFERSSWDAGRRAVDCTAARYDSSGSPIVTSEPLKS